MFSAIESPFLVPFDGNYAISGSPTLIDERPTKKQLKKQLKAEVARLHDLQRVFYAHDRHALLLVFQAMDAAGKDSTIRSVMQGVDPSGCQVFSFKKPSDLELERGDHSFLVEYEDFGGEAGFEMSWVPPGAEQPQEIPASLLRPSSGPQRIENAVVGE